jgi:hypothetical protein
MHDKEILQISKSKPKKISILCTFNKETLVPVVLVDSCMRVLTWNWICGSSVTILLFSRKKRLWIIAILVCRFTLHRNMYIRKRTLANLIFVSKMHFLLSLWYLCDLLICAIIIVTAGKP